MGYEPGSGTASVARFKFRTGSEGASSLSFKTADCYPAYHAAGDESVWDWVGSMRWQLTEEADGLENCHSSDGQPCLSPWLSGSGEAELLPEHDYYLWLYPDYSHYAVWHIGTLSVTLEGSYGKASTAAVPDGEFGTELSISIDRSDSRMLHSLTVSCAGRTETIARKSSRWPIFKWTPKLEDFAPLITHADSAEAVLSVETFLDGRSLGSTESRFTLRFPADKLLPIAQSGWFSVSPYNAGTAAEGMACFVDGISRAELSFDAGKIDLSGLYGAELSRFVLRHGTVNCAAAPYLSGVLSGFTVLYLDAVDSRGHKATSAFSFTPLSYAPPALSLAEVYRCDAEGNEDEQGSFCRVRAAGKYSSLGGENSLSLSVACRSFYGEYGEEMPLVGGKAEILSGFDPDRSWEVRLTAADALGGTATRVFRLPARSWAMKFSDSGTAVGFGKAPEADKVLEIAEDWNIRRGGRNLDWFVPALVDREAIPKGSDLNSYTAVGSYAAKTGAIGASCLNSPTTRAFSLDVRNSLGNSYADIPNNGSYYYTVQELENTVGARWYRAMTYNPSVGTPSFGAWKRLLDSDCVLNYSLTLSPDKWSGSGPYTQTVSVSGIGAADRPLMDIDLSDAAFAELEKRLREYACIYRFTTAANSVTVYSTAPNSLAMKLNLQVVRA